MASHTRLTAEHCDLFNLPCYQFSQLRQYAPDSIDAIKAAYKSAWQDWRAVIRASAALLGADLTEPHIERWCNGWQVRAHFFAYFKSAHLQNSAAILAILLNRRRLTVHLDWHSYRENRSTYTLTHYNHWTDALAPRHRDLHIWHGASDEYADTRPYSAQAELPAHNKHGFLCIGRHLEREQLARHDTPTFIAATITELLPLYHAAHPILHANK